VTFRETHHLGGIGDGIRGARHLRSTYLLCDVTGPDLVAQALDGLGWRADPRQTRVHDGAGEVGVLGQETVAGVHRIGAGSAGHVQELLDVQVGVGGSCAAQGERLVRECHEQRIRIGVGIHCDGGDARVARSPDHPDSDLPAVAYQDLRDDLVAHLLPPPCRTLPRSLAAIALAPGHG
jgi:hypothetical protein